MVPTLLLGNQANAALAPLNISIEITSPRIIVTEHFRDLFLEYAVTSLATTTPLYEQILPKAPAPQRAVLYGLIKAFIERLAPVNRLTILDPYFFSSGDPAAYASVVADILDRTAPKVSTITFMRDSTKDKPGVSAAVQMPSKPSHLSAHNDKFLNTLSHAD